MTNRTYENDTIRVHWKSDLCLHTGICLQGDPSVFDTGRRPWIDLGDSDADEVASVVQRCPTGALSYERKDGGAEEPRPGTTTIIPYPNGALSIRGAIEIRDAEGNLVAEGTRMALCRCGHSGNKPFCDMSHVDAGFTDAPTPQDPTGDNAESPGDISENPLVSG